MKYYDANSMKVRDTEEEEIDEIVQKNCYQKAKNISNILMLIVVPLIVITVVLQIIWFNIILHTILCSSILAICLSMLICGLIQNDKKALTTPVFWMVFWAFNLIVNLIKHFIS